MLWTPHCHTVAAIAIARSLRPALVNVIFLFTASSQRVGFSSIIPAGFGLTLLPFHVLRRVFRGKFVEGLHSLNLRSLPLGAGHCFENIGSSTPNHRFGGPEYVLHYLGRYTHRVAISDHRLVSFDDGRSPLRWRDSAHNNQQKLMTLSLDEFLPASSCICSPRALSASATLVSSPGVAELSFCRCALQPSTPQQCKPKRQYPQPRRQAPIGCIQTVADPW